MPIRWKILPLALLLFGALGLLLLGDEARAAGRPSTSLAADASTTEAPLATLAELRADPSAFLGRRVRLRLQFARVLETWNPWLTRFGSGDWIGLAAWSDTAFTWERGVFEDPLERIFVRRSTAVAALVDRAAPYRRFEVEAVVREVFLDEPWIELESARPLTEFVGEGSILHAARGRELMVQENWELALDQLERALVGPLPAAALAELERLAELCRVELQPRATRRAR